MAIDTISRALSGQASTAAKQAKETADSAMEQAISAVPGAVAEWLEDNVTPTTPAVDASLSIAGAAADAKATGDGIANLKSAIDNLGGRVSEIAEYPNLANPALFTNGRYMAPDGNTYAAAGLFYTAKIPVISGQIIKANHRARFITAFSGDSAISESGVNDQTGSDTTISYTVPTGIDSLVFTFRIAYQDTLIIYVYNGEDYGYIPYNEIAYIKTNALSVPLRVITSKEGRPIYKETSGTAFAPNTFISLPVYSCTRKNTRLIFRAGGTSSLGNFEIGFTTSANASGTKYNRFIVKKNAVTIYYSYNYNTQQMNSVEVRHDLNITTGSLQIIIEEHPNATCTLTIENKGNTFKHTFEGYVKNNTLQPYCYSAYGSFANYKFVWSCTDLYKKIWIFGDSYMAYSDARWPYYLEEYGYAKNALFNSFPGCWSSTAITALNSLINYGNPKYIVWAMGMNDGSDSESAPSTSWADNRDSFIAICEENNIEPVFCTIPTVPTVNNEQKNAWIKNSGYRYIDFARAVNATSSGTWSSGTLSSDGVHPTVNGARVLFAEFLLDFPEIMLGLDGVYSNE